jgi:hypothetical protein
MSFACSRRRHIAIAWVISLALILAASTDVSAQDDYGHAGSESSAFEHGQPPQYIEVDGEALRVAGPYEPTVDYRSTMEWGIDEVVDMTILVQRFVEGRWPEEVAGVWVDSDGGGNPITVVATVESVPLDEALDSIRQEYPGTYPIEVVHHEWSFAELDELAEDLFLAGREQAAQMDRDPSDQARRTRRLGWRQELQRAGFPTASMVDIDVMDNQISVWTSAALPRGRNAGNPQSNAVYPHDAGPSRQEQQASDLLTDMVGAPVAVIENGAPHMQTHDCYGRQNCYPNMIGGLGIRPTSTSGIPGCSTGFAAYGASGRRFAITAGHCISAGSTWWNSGVQYGTLERAVMENYVDQGRIVFDRNNWRHFGEIWLGQSGEKTRTVQSYMRWSDVPVGTTDFIGVSAGRANTVFRGFVATRHARVYAGGNPIDRVIALRASSVGAVCTQPGDSGSPWFRNNAAVAVHHGANLNQYPCSDSRHRAFGTSIEYGLDALNLYLIYG